VKTLLFCCAEEWHGVCPVLTGAVVQKGGTVSVQCWQGAVVQKGGTVSVQWWQGLLCRRVARCLSSGDGGCCAEGWHGVCPVVTGGCCAEGWHGVCPMSPMLMLFIVY